MHSRQASMQPSRVLANAVPEKKIPSPPAVRDMEAEAMVSAALQALNEYEQRIRQEQEQRENEARAQREAEEAARLAEEALAKMPDFLRLDPPPEDLVSNIDFPFDYFLWIVLPLFPFRFRIFVTSLTLFDLFSPSMCLVNRPYLLLLRMDFIGQSYAQELLSFVSAEA